MLTQSKDQLIIDGILKSKDNLQAALAIINVEEKLRIQIIKGFVDKIIARVRADAAMEQWEILNDFERSNYEEKYCGIFLQKKAWKGQYSVGIEGQNKGSRDFIAGACAGNAKSKKLVDKNKIKQVLEHEFKSGKSSEGWDYYFYVDAPWHDWTATETLVNLYFAPDEGVEYFAKLLIRLAQAVERVVDESLANSK